MKREQPVQNRRIQDVRLVDQRSSASSESSARADQNSLPPPADDDDSTVKRVDTLIQDFKTDVAQGYATLQQELKQDDEAPTTENQDANVPPTYPTLEELNVGLELLRLRAMQQDQELAGSVTTLGPEVVSVEAVKEQLAILRKQLNVLLDMHSREASTDTIDRINVTSASITRLEELLPTIQEREESMVASIAGIEDIQDLPSQTGSEESDMFPGFSAGANTDDMSSLEGSL
jgi:hypothetical protein